MKKFVLMLLVLVMVVGCSKKSANERNFSAAMKQYFEKKGDVCINSVGVDKEFSKNFNYFKKELDVLVAVGLVKVEEFEKTTPSYFGRQQSVKMERFSFTDAAKPFIKESSNPFLGKTKDLCWAKKSLDKIVKWNEPIKLGEYQSVNVVYKYKLNNIVDWAKKPEVQEAFPAIKRAIEDESKNHEHGLHLTNEGWEANGLGIN